MQEDIRVKLGFENCFVFGFIGTFGHWHGIEVLEFIIPQVCDTNPRARFLLIGDGVLKAHAQEVLQKYIIEKKVIFTGKIAQDQAPEYLAVCDAYVCPTQPNSDGTRFFGSPTKLFEYMSMGKPVIGSDLEQLSEILSPAIKVQETSVVQAVSGQVGILINPLDWQGFIHACQMCLTMSDQDLNKLGKNARKKVLENYTWQKHVEKIITFFERTVSNETLC